ncbi:MAG: ferritin family protein [Candidatus Aminicenantia bacterium]
MNLSPAEILAQAIKSEKEAKDLYSTLYQKVKNEVLRSKLRFLMFEEDKHQEMLRRLFSQRFSRGELKLPNKSFLPKMKVGIDERTSVLDLFKLAMEAEKESEEFYLRAAKKSKEKGNRRMFNYLSRVERSHFFMIKSEIDLLSEFPDYYNVEDFHFGHEMVHIGP